MKTYSEVFKDYNLIGALKSVDSGKFNEIFGADYDDILLDDYIKFENGNSLVYEQTELLVSNNGVEKLAKILWLLYYSNWKKTLKTLAVDYENSYTEKETVEDTHNRKNQNNHTSSSSDKIFAYDSETASNDSMNDSTSDDDNNEDYKGNTVRTKSGYNYSNYLFELLKQYKDFDKENTFCNIVKNDIISYTCVYVY